MSIIIDGTNGISDLDGSAATPAFRGTDSNTGEFFPAADTIAWATNGTERMRLTSAGDLQFNSGYGSVATAYGCRAWVNFNGTGTVAIRASGNVTSITDNGTGDYTVNFTTAMPDVNFSAQASATDTGTVTALNYVAFVGQKTTSSQRVALRTVSGAQVFADALNFEVAIFR